MRLPNVLMSVRLSSVIPEDEKPLLMRKLSNLHLYCAAAGCYSLRKEAPKNPRFPRSRYCVEHAKIAKANAQERGMYQGTFNKTVDKPPTK
jgi:hypothetical protein